MRKTGHTDNSIEKKIKRGCKAVEIVVGVEEVGNCSIDHVCVPSSVGIAIL